MKIRRLLAAAIFATATILPIVGLVTPVQAVGDQIVVQCPQNIQLDVIGDVPHVCDLAVDKQVSVNGGPFVEADTSPDAANAQVGDTITWKVIVTNNSTDGLTPHGVVYVKDALPSGVAFQSYVATDGTYIGDNGSFFANNWVLPLLKSDGDDGFVTTLPATLTLITKATSTGLIENTAAFNKYDPGSCDGGCAYIDADSDNNSNDAWVNIQVKPQVLGESTSTPQVLGLSNTGTSVVMPSIVALSLITSTMALGYIGRGRRQKYSERL